jgi:hypothetical protein
LETICEPDAASIAPPEVTHPAPAADNPNRHGSDHARHARALLGHLPKERRAKSTWQHVEAALKQAATGDDATELWAALQMVLMLEGVEYRLN